jgi:hypothetical protein
MTRKPAIDSQDLEWIAYGNSLLAAAPVPIVLKMQGRLSLFRVRRQELYCSLKNGRLRIVCYRPWKIRHIQVASLISEAVARLGVVSLPPFYVNSADKPREKRRPITVFANCSVDGHADVAAPDFIFEGWPEAKFKDFDAKAASLAAASASVPLHDRAFWTGRCENAVRGSLVAISARHPDKVEAVDAMASYDRQTNLYRGAFKTMEEQVADYRYMIDVEGFGYSGRLKLLLHAARVVLIQDRLYRDYFFSELEPFRHFVPVARDLSDLVERIEWLRTNPAREAEIVREAQHFARMKLTRRAAVEAWARLLEDHIAAGGNLRSGVERLPRAAI